jgi:hypothetical protein
MSCTFHFAACFAQNPFAFKQDFAVGIHPVYDDASTTLAGSTVLGLSSPHADTTVMTSE